jgi:RNA polymerase sigma-70 factor (ECF subfamily)
MNSAQYSSPISQCPGQELTAREEEVLLIARVGSHAAFAELRKLYAHRLYKLILSMIKSRQDAEDALQDMFLRAYRVLPPFEGRFRFSSWLTRIAINSALTILRKRAALLNQRASIYLLSNLGTRA